MYCSEKVEAKVEEGTVSGDAFDAAVKVFYAQLYDTVMNGKELVITPEMASEVIRIIEQCYAQNPMPIIY